VFVAFICYFTIRMKKLYITIFTVFTLLGFQANANIVLPADVVIQVARFYPNPASSSIIFEFKNFTKQNRLQVYGFTGKRLIDMPVNDNRIQILLDGFYRGVYIFQLKDKDGNILDSGKFQVVK
jgi:hypothetical protein